MEEFNITDAYDVQDLTDVVEEKNIFPATKGLKVRIAKAAPQMNKNKDIFSLKLELRVVDGIVVKNVDNDGEVVKYVNKPLFTGMMDLVYGALNADTRDKEGKVWWKKKQHLVEFKKFCSAMGISLSGIVINDDFFANLIGGEVLVDVIHEEQTSVDQETGKKVKNGQFREKLKNWSKVV